MVNNANTTEHRDVQAVFDTVIDAGYYGELQPLVSGRVSPYMCIALNYARDDGVITWDECTLAKTEISNYLPECVSKLVTALAMNNLPHCFTSRLALYRDWANRPPLT